MNHNNSNNLEASFMKLSDKIKYFIKDLLMFGNNLLRVNVLSLWRSKDQKYPFVINEI